MAATPERLRASDLIKAIKSAGIRFGVSGSSSPLTAIRVHGEARR